MSPQPGNFEQESDKYVGHLWSCKGNVCFVQHFHLWSKCVVLIWQHFPNKLNLWTLQVYIGIATTNQLWYGMSKFTLVVSHGGGL